MTLDQFIKKLGRTKRRWILSGSSIRACSGPNYYCPLTGVVKAETGHILTISEYKEAGLTLGLSADEVQKIMEAADKAPQASQRLRKRLLKACGLEAALLYES